MTMQLIARFGCVPYVSHAGGWLAWIVLTWSVLLIVLQGIWLYSGHFYADKTDLWPASGMAGWCGITIAGVGACAFRVLRREYRAYVTANCWSRGSGEESRITVVASPSFVVRLQQMSGFSIAHRRFRVFPHGAFGRVLLACCLAAFVVGLSASAAFRSWRIYVDSVALGTSLLFAVLVSNSICTEWLEVTNGVVTRLHRCGRKWSAERVFDARHSNVRVDMSVFKPAVIASTPAGQRTVRLQSVINPYGFVEALYSTVMQDARGVSNTEPNCASKAGI